MDLHEMMENYWYWWRSLLRVLIINIEASAATSSLQPEQIPLPI